jgi:hypothetical protein
MGPVPEGALVHEITWNTTEMRIARATFDAALKVETAVTLADDKLALIRRIAAA